MTRWKEPKNYEASLSYIAAWKSKGELSKDNIALLEITFFDIAKDMGVTINELVVSNDNVLVSFETNPTHAPHYVIQKFKNRTARLIKDSSFPDGVWNREYKVCSVGDADFDEFL